MSGARFKGKVVAVTGVSRGLGLAIGELLAAEGAEVAGGDIDPPANSKLAAFELDVSKRASCAEFFRKVQGEFGRLDVLINNAGIIRNGPSAEMSEDDWRSVLDVGLDGTFFCSQAAYPALRKSGDGTIVNISSMNGQMGWPGRANYGTTKAGIIGLTRALAVEWANDNIRVNAVAPGYINTELVSARTKTGELNMDRLLTRIPLRRIAEPAEIAAVVAFLASAESSYVTGQTIVADGGWLAYGGE
jgi:NAD(P)-dependent dehydrogenase (short-subunit alcohol dehydrogenase family)